MYARRRLRTPVPTTRGKRRTRSRPEHRSAEVIERDERMDLNRRGTRGRLRCVGRSQLPQRCSCGLFVCHFEGRDPHLSIDHHGVASDGLDDRRSCPEDNRAVDGLCCVDLVFQARTTNAACEHTTSGAAWCSGVNQVTSQYSCPMQPWIKTSMPVSRRGARLPSSVRSSLTIRSVPHTNSDNSSTSW